ncbi:PREDICTED: haptoglobin-like, partial [Leptosomus discolor]|uniref:haptoglobin-like n=1 Tax=Leptosomus discolor TaxID=188344 RepID=UPI000522C05A
CRIPEILGTLASHGGLAGFPGASARPAVNQVGLFVLFLLGKVLAAYSRVRRPAVLLIAGLAWTVLETTTASEWSCAKPAEIEHGYVEHLIKYRCNPYYQLRGGSGDGMYKCSEDHGWVSLEAGKEVPVCEPVCGKPKNPPGQMQRIIGGLLARKGSFPWQDLNHSEDTKPEEIAPTLQLFLGGREQPALGVERVVLHPGYPEAVDLALLKLKQKVLLGEEVMPICLPRKDYVQPGRVGYVSGWGRGATFAFPDTMKYVMLPVAEGERCRQYYRARNASYWVQPVLSNDTFCVGMSELREDTCYGDAGGAFAVRDPDDDSWYAAGI